MNSDPKITDEQYRAAARKHIVNDVTVFVDPSAVVERGENGGAYVTAHVWIEDGDTTPIAPKNDPS